MLKRTTLSGQDRTGQDRTGQDRTGQELTLSFLHGIKQNISEMDNRRILMGLVYPVRFGGFFIYKNTKMEVHIL